MAVELQALGGEEGQQAVLPLEPNQTFRLGRAPQEGWHVGWDRLIPGNMQTWNGSVDSSQFDVLIAQRIRLFMTVRRFAS